MFAFIAALSLAFPSGASLAKENLSDVPYESFDLPDLEHDEVIGLKKFLRDEGISEVDPDQFSNDDYLKGSDPLSSISMHGEEIPYKRSERRENNKNNLSNYGKTFQTPSISATDNRIKVNNTKVNPYNATAKIDILRYDDTGARCSGSFITPTHVLTAAHCVYDAYNNTFHKGFAVTPGVNSDGAPYGTYGVTNSWVTRGWASSTPKDPGSVYLTDVVYDFAVLKVEKAHQYNLNVGKAKNSKASIEAIGYPGDKGYFNMYRSPGKISEFNNGAIVHSGYITGGQSGGPIREENSTNSVVSTSSWGPQFKTFHLNIIRNWESL